MIVGRVEEGRAAVAVTALEQPRVAPRERDQFGCVVSAVVGGPVERGERGPQQPPKHVPQRAHWPLDQSADS